MFLNVYGLKPMFGVLVQNFKSKRYLEITESQGPLEII